MCPKEGLSKRTIYIGITCSMAANDGTTLNLLATTTPPLFRPKPIKNYALSDNVATQIDATRAFVKDKMFQCSYYPKCVTYHPISPFKLWPPVSFLEFSRIL